MNFSQVTQLLTRRWQVILVGVVLGAALGFFSAPGEGSAPPKFRSNTVLIENPGVSTRLEVETTAVLVTSGAVPQRVAERLGISVEAARSGVGAVPNKVNSSLTILVSDVDPKAAKERSALFGEELVNQLGGGELSNFQSRLESLQTRVREQQATVLFLEQTRENELAAGSGQPATLTALQDARRTLIDSRSTLQTLENQGPPKPQLLILETLSAVRVSGSGGGFKVPDAPILRAGVLALFGLLMGFAGAVTLDRVDTKIRIREDAEEAFGAQIVGEIPFLHKTEWDSPRIMLGESRNAPFVEAYRALRTVIALNFSDREIADRDGTGPPDHRVIVVTSATASEGKTTTVAHLAVLLAEIDKTVLVVSGDFRRPLIHEFFGLGRSPGFVDALEAGTPIIDTVRETGVENVRLLASGEPTRNPARAMLSAAKLIRAARDVFDYVLVDTAPVLVANDASQLMQVADAVLLTARAGSTRREAAMKATSALSKVDAPLLGVVLCGSNDTDLAYYYYRSPYALPDESKLSWRGLRRAARREAEEQRGVESGNGQSPGSNGSTDATTEPADQSDDALGEAPAIEAARET